MHAPTRYARALRTLLIAITLVSVTGCPSLDVNDPIVLVPGPDWEPWQVEAMEDAARCWRLELGVDLRVGRNEPVQQQVPVVFHEFTCVFGAGRLHPNYPVSLYLCPLDYITFESGYAIQLFWILLHEIGHVLNIRPHAKDPGAIMAPDASGWYPTPDRFTEADRSLFRRANPRFTATSPCASVRIESRGCVCVGSVRCGDGTVDVDLDEQCDDGNNMSGDGCSAECEVE